MPGHKYKSRKRVKGVWVYEYEGVTRVGKIGVAPPGPPSGFGKERTREDYRRRIDWEGWAAAKAREDGKEATAQGHDMARKHYITEHDLALSSKRGFGRAESAKPKPKSKAKSGGKKKAKPKAKVWSDDAANLHYATRPSYSV
jgi:hypothetical protein